MDAQVVTASDQSSMCAGGTQAVVSTREFTSHAAELERLCALQTTPTRSEPPLPLLPDEARVLRWHSDLLWLLTDAATFLDSRAQNKASVQVLQPAHNTLLSGPIHTPSARPRPHIDE